MENIEKLSGGIMQNQAARVFVLLLLAVSVLFFPLAKYGLAQDADKMVAPGLSGPPVLAENFTGAAISSFPLLVPPGRADIAPNLQLQYNSYSKVNSWVGVGWTLDLGSIRRTTKNGVDYNGNDFTAVINGGSQQLVQRPDWGAGYYGQESDSSFLRYHMVSGTEGSYWIVTATNGTQYVYGQSHSSRIETESGEVLHWHLDRVIDTNGNYMNIRYYQESDATGSPSHLSDIYPRTIEYTGNANTGLPPSSSVNFYLQNRPEIVVRHEGGREIRTTSRLAAISMYTGGNHVRTYELTYNDLTQRPSLLGKITLHGANTTVTANDENFLQDIVSNGGLTAAKFEYTSSDIEIANHKYSGYDHNNHVFGYMKRFVGDVNGDGRSDMIYVKTGAYPVIRVWVSGADGGTTEIAQPFPSTGGNLSYFVIRDVYVADVNGDGKTDILYMANDGSGAFHVLSYDGAGWASYSIAVPSYDSEYPPSSTQFCDLTGDGRADIVRVYNTNRIEVLVNVGDSFVSHIYPPGLAVQPFLFQGDPHFIDANGDGFTDIAFTTASQIQMFLSNGDGTLRKGSTTSALCTDNIWNIGDANGDGLQDMVCTGNSGEKLIVYPNKGDGFFSPGIASNLGNVDYTKYRRILADMDGNGTADAVYMYESKIYVFPGKNDYTYGTAYQKNLGTSFYSTHWINTAADATGDGKADIIYLCEYHHAVFVSNLAPVNLLFSITDYFGATTTLSYHSSSQYQNQMLPFALQTLGSVSLNDGLGNVSTTSFSYTGGYFDYVSREFRGFQSSTRVNPDGTSAVTWFHQDNKLKGKAFKSETFDMAGALLDRINFNWETVPVGNSTFVRLASKVTESHDADATLWVRNEYAYNNTHGGLVSETTCQLGAGTQTCASSSATSERISVTTSYGQYGDWIWRPLTTTVYDRTGVKVRQTLRAFYDGIESGGALGALKYEESWLNSGINPRTTYSYDQYGNILTVRNPRGSVTATEYDDASHTYPVKIRLFRELRG